MGDRTRGSLYSSGTIPIQTSRERAHGQLESLIRLARMGKFRTMYGAWLHGHKAGAMTDTLSTLFPFPVSHLD